MAAGLRSVLAASDLITVVLEVRDARLPRSTAVAAQHKKLRAKPLIVVLNHADLAAPAVTKEWLADFARQGVRAFACVGTRAATLRPVREALLADKRTPARAVRAAVVGAPNTGKSSIINALARRRSTQTQDRPGVTRAIQWIRLDGSAQLLDTPGVLAPRIGDPTSAWRLAACGVLAESAVDIEDVAAKLALDLHAQDLESYARQHGMLRRAGTPDTLNAARAFLKEFRDGRLGRHTFERPEHEGQA